MHPGTIPGTFELRRDQHNSRQMVFTGKSVTLDLIAAYLSDITTTSPQYPLIINSTMISTRFDFTIMFANPELANERKIPDPPTVLLDLPGALGSAFGLAVAEKRAPVKSLIIDHMDSAPKAAPKAR
jgi:uncharacterized protein (TIGR03435 family)